jgi:hypothetical protein
MIRNRLVRFAGAALLLSGCAGLDVKNPNNPDIERALASGEDVKNIAISTVNSWYLTSTYLYPYLAYSTACDCGAANFGNFGMRFHNVEPRAPYINSTSAGDDRLVTQDAWTNNYSTMGAANDVLKAMDIGVQINDDADSTAKYGQLAKFTQAASLTNLAWQFDSAFVVDEDFDATAGAPSLQVYTAVSTAALAKWDALIAELATASFDYDNSIIPFTSPTVFSSANLRRIANTLSALTLRLTPRTRAELDAKPASFWTDILARAQAGINFDVVVQGDFNNWYSYINYYGNENSWMRVDHRVINRLDAFGPNAPVHFRYRSTADIMAPQNPTTNDQRLGNGAAGKDFRFRNAVIGDPARGIFMQSAYSHDRYIAHSRSSATAAATPVPYILRAENDLLIAEALIKTGGDRNLAATLINNTRVTRGALTPMTVANSNAELLTAIDHERDVELYATNGLNFYYARTGPDDTPLGGTNGRLQTGTQRHWPLPARELETLAKTVYTYGGAGNADMIVIGANGERSSLRQARRPARPTELFFAQKY